MAALPFCEILEQQGLTLGAQPRRRWQELALRRGNAARQLGADPKSLMWWEQGEREPADRFYPAIIAFWALSRGPSRRHLPKALQAERRRCFLGLAAKATFPQDLR
jgi:hypothetical protein